MLDLVSRPLSLWSDSLQHPLMFSHLTPSECVNFKEAGQDLKNKFISSWVYDAITDVWQLS